MVLQRIRRFFQVYSRYWAGSWYQTLTDNLIKNNVDENLVELAPIAEVGAYLNREAPVWVIIDDGDGDNSREQAILMHSSRP